MIKLEYFFDVQTYFSFAKRAILLVKKQKQFSVQHSVVKIAVYFINKLLFVIQWEIADQILKIQ